MKKKEKFFNPLSFHVIEALIQVSDLDVVRVGKIDWKPLLKRSKEVIFKVFNLVFKVSLTAN